MSNQVNVAPRYTCGSPALVNSQIANRVAAQEQRSYNDHLEGVYGAELQRKAEQDGLALIAFTMKETRKGWEVEDLITGEKHFWPFKAECPTCGLKSECDRGVLREHRVKGGWSTCINRGYMGSKRQTYTD